MVSVFFPADTLSTIAWSNSSIVLLIALGYRYTSYSLSVLFNISKVIASVLALVKEITNPFSSYTVPNSNSILLSFCVYCSCAKSSDFLSTVASCVEFLYVSSEEVFLFDTILHPEKSGSFAPDFII